MKKMMLASLMTMAVGGASAQAYVGGAIGMSHANLDCKGTQSCDADDTGYKLYAGYKFNSMFAVEAGYLDLGKASASQFGLKADIKNSAPFVVGALRGAFTQNLSGVARLGLANVETTLDAGAFGSKSETKSQALIGLALEYAFNKQLKGSVDIDATNSNDVNMYPAYLSGGSIYMISVGVQYGF